MAALAGSGEGFAPEDEDDEAERIAASHALEPDDAERPVDDSLADEVPGIDAERRVDLADESHDRQAAAAAADDAPE